MKELIFNRLDKRKKAADTTANLLLFVVVYLVSGVIFAVDHQFPEPNETAKFLKLVSLIPIVSVSTLFLLLLRQNIKFTILDLSALLLLAYYLISVFVKGTEDPRNILLPIALVAIYTMVRTTASRGNEGLKWITLAILCVSIFELILGLKQIYGSSASNHYQYDATGSFFNPGPFGGYLAFIFAISLSTLVKMRNKEEEFLCAFKQRHFNKLLTVDVPLFFVSFATCILSFLLLPATMSRSAWMAVCLVSVIVMIEVGAFKKIHNYFSNHKSLLIPLVLIVSGMMLASIFAIYFLKKDSAESRLFSWQISTKTIMNHPVTGVGVGYFGGVYAKQQAQYFAEKPKLEHLYVADCPTYAFNEYLQIGVELGLLGLALFMLVIILAFRYWKKPDPFQYGLIAILVFAFTSYPLHIVPLLILFVVSIAAREDTVLLSGRLAGKVFFAVISIAVLAICMVTHPQLNKHTEALTEWKRLQFMYGVEMYKTDEYAIIYPSLKHDYKFLFEYGHSLNKVGEYEQSNEILRQGTKLSNDPMFYNIIGNNYLALKEYESAEKSYEMAYNIVPSRIYPLYLLAKLYAEKEDIVKALMMCRKVLEFTPKVLSPAVSEIKKEIEELMHSLENN